MKIKMIKPKKMEFFLHLSIQINRGNVKREKGKSYQPVRANITKILLAKFVTLG